MATEQLHFWSLHLHNVFTVLKGIWRGNVPGLIVALIQAEPGGLQLSLALQLYLTGPEPWERAELEGRTLFYIFTGWCPSFALAA